MNKFRTSLPPLTSLIPFEATARLGSVTKASAELHLTQAAISKQIRSLEDDLGLPLFERRNRALHLTEDGNAFQQVVADALDSIGVSANRLRRSHEEGEVVIFSQLCEGLYWLMPALSGFYQQHPHIECRVSVSTEPLTEYRDRYDLAIQTSGRDAGNAKPLLTVPDEVFPVCSPRYLEQYEAPIPAMALEQHKLLHHKVYPQDWVDWDDWFAGLKLDVRVGYKGSVFDSYPMMLEATLEGHGIALGWQRTTDRLLRSGQLVKPCAESLKLIDGVSVYTPGDRKLRANAAVFLEWLKREMK